MAYPIEYGTEDNRLTGPNLYGVRIPVLAKNLGVVGGEAAFAIATWQVGSGAISGGVATTGATYTAQSRSYTNVIAASNNVAAGVTVALPATVYAESVLVKNQSEDQWLRVEVVPSPTSETPTPVNTLLIPPGESDGLKPNGKFIGAVKLWYVANPTTAGTTEVSFLPLATLTANQIAVVEFSDLWTAAAVAPPPPPSIAPTLSTAGTANMLASAAPAAAMSLLTTQPTTGSVRVQYHTTFSYDTTRGVALVFGADTHVGGTGNNADNYNGVDVWKSSDGLVHQIFAPTPYPGTYTVSAPQGHRFGNAAKTVPPAFHTYVGGIIANAAAATLKTVVSPIDHVPYPSEGTVEPGADTVDATRGRGFWTFDYSAATWAYEPHYGDNTHEWLVRTKEGGTTIDDVANNRYLCFYDNWIYALDKTSGVITNHNVTAIANVTIVSRPHIVGANVFNFGGQSTTLVSRHSLASLTTGQRWDVSTFPALAGYSVVFSWSALLPDNRIAFCAQNTTTGQQRIFTFDTTTFAVADTGVAWASTWAASGTTFQPYQFGAQYVAALGGVLFWDHRTVANTRQWRLWKL